MRAPDWLLRVIEIAVLLAIVGTTVGYMVAVAVVSWWAGLIVFSVPALLVLGVYWDRLIVGWRDWRELRAYR